MPYIGTPAVDRFTSTKAASVFSGDGSTTAFTLDHAVGSDEDILVSVDGVIQEPSVAYAVSNGTTLTFTAAPSSNSGNNIFVYYLFRTVGTVGHPSNQALSASTGTFSDNVTLTGTTPTLTIGDAGAEDTKIVFDGNAQDYHIGLDDSIDELIIGKGSTLGTTDYIRVDADGNITKPSQPCFSSGATTTNIPLATTTKVTLSSERFDVGSNVSSDTFTAPVTGKYLFTYIFYFSSLDADHTTLDATIKTSNTQYQQTVKPSAFLNSDANFSLTGSMICDMDANDTFFMNVYVQAGSAQTDIHTDSHVSGVLIC